MKTIRPGPRQLIWLVVPTLCSLLYAAENVPKELSKSDWQSIRAAYEAGRHEFRPVEGGWQARNPGQQWTTHFDNRGFLATPRDGGWTWGLELKSYGFGQSQHQILNTPAVKANGQRLIYQWDDTVEEWFVNDQRGLEHGFTVAMRPDAGAAGQPEPLTFLLATRGTLRPRISTDGQDVVYQDNSGAAVLTYTGLKVTDASGRTLPSRFEPSSGDAVWLLVDETYARYPITIDPIAQQAYLKASNTGAGDWFGYSVAVSGDTVVVGAIGEDSGTTGVNSTPTESATDSGAAYVFVRSGSTWTQQAYLKASNTGAGDNFGFAAAIAVDSIVIGARLEDSSTTGVNTTPNDSATDSGAAYVFTRSGSTWTQQAYLKGSNTGAADYFGTSVALSGDTIVIGAVLEDGGTTGVNSTPDDGATNSGAAYVFNRSGTTWTQQAYLKASNTGANDYFGGRVAVSGDTVAISAVLEDSSTTGVNSTPNDSGTDSGAVYVFARSGTIWSQQAYLKASNTGVNDQFGDSVSISGDTVVVGAGGEDSSTTGVNGTPNDSAADSGAAYVFVRNGTTWAEQAYLKASNTAAGDAFSIVAVSDDTVVVGAYGEDGNAIGVDGNQSDNSAADAGAAYVFTRSGTVWTQRAYLKAGSTGPADRFGFSVAMSGDTAVVGAFQEDSNTTGVNSTPNESSSNAGAAYVYNGLGPSPTPYSWTNFVGMPGSSGSLDGSGSAARFSTPAHAAISSDGNIFVVDQDNQIIRRITPSGVVTTFAGAMGVQGATDGIGTAAKFRNPSGLAFDSAGYLYVSDYGNHTIRRIDPGGVVTTYAGSAGVSGSLDGSVGTARFSYPRGLVVDSGGNIIVADWGNNTIRMISPGGMVSTLAGSPGMAGAIDGTGSTARFSAPSGVAADSFGNIYVADSDFHIVRKVTSSGTVTTLAGSPGTSGTTDGFGGAARFRYPTGIAMSPGGFLLVADYNNHTVRKVTFTGQVTTVGGLGGSSGSMDGIGTNSRFYRPYSMAISPDGIVYLCDLYNSRISKGIPASLLNGCVAWWRGEDNFQDSGGTNHGTGLNGVSFAAGEVGRCMSFDGTNDSVQVPTSANLNLVSGQGWTMEGWIKPDVLTDRYLAHKGTSANGTTPYWCVYLRNDSPAGRLAFEMCPGTGMNQYDFSKSVTPVTAGVWQHIAVVVDSMGGSVDGIHYYINGVDAGRTDLRDWATSGTVTNAEPLQIGSFRGQGVFFDGLIDELSIYNRALSPTEISAIHAAGSAGKLGGVPPTIATASQLPDGMVGMGYSQSLSATGGVAPYSWAVSGGSLPESLSLSSGGVITGTPSAAGTATFTVRVTDNAGGTTTKNFSLTIASLPIPPTISTASPLPAGQVGVPYSLAISATDGVPPYAWSVTGGVLPEGMALSSGGLLDGTPTTAGSANFTVSVTGGDGGSATKEFTITVDPAMPPGLGLSSLSLFNASLSPAFNRATTAYTSIIPIDFTRIEATPANPASSVEWRVGSGDFETFTTGNPLQLPLVMGANTVELRVTTPETDMTTYTLTLTRVPGTISDSFNADVADGWGGTTGLVARTSALAVQADHKVVVGGLFYEGGGTIVKLARFNANGTLDATFEPNVAGGETLWITALVAQADGKILVAGSFDTIGGAAVSNLARLNPDGTLDSGFVPTLSYPPAHIQIQTDGKILIAGWGGLERLNSNGSTDPGFNPPAMGYGPKDLAVQPDGKILALYESPGVVRYNADGNVDAGFTTENLDVTGNGINGCMALRSDGKILVAGLVSTDDFLGIVRLNSDGTLDPTYFIDFDEGGMGVLTMLPQADGAVVMGGEFTQIGGQTRQSLARLLPSGAVDGNFIPGVEVDGIGYYSHASCLASLPDGRIMVGGEFSQIGGKRRSGVGRLMSDGQGPAITISTASRLPGGTVGEPYSMTLSASGGIPPYHWRIVGGLLDEGLALNAAGVISGVPTGMLGGNTITIEASDPNGWAATKEFILVTGELYVRHAPDLPWGIVDKPYDLELEIWGGTAPFACSIIGGSLPNGLVMSANGRITGTPVATGTSQVTLRVVDSDGIWKEQTLNLAIQATTDLCVLQLSGMLTPEFDPEVTSYQAESSVDDQINMSALQADPDASLQIRINGSPYQSWIPDPWLGTDFALNPGVNMIDILVTGSGNQTKTYTIMFTRAFPLISVQSGDTALVDGGLVPVGFGTATLGRPSLKSFTVTNAGTAPLSLGASSLTGANAADFAVELAQAQVLAPGGSTSFNVTFRPQGGGERVASIHIGSNSLGDLASFDIMVSGNALSYVVDSDGDGMKDGAEFDLAALGFDWQQSQLEMVTAYYAGANGAGLYTAGQLQALCIGTPMISKDPATGEFQLTIRIAKSTDLANFTLLPVAPSQMSINANGEIELRFTSQNDAAFFRLEGK